MNKKDRIAIVLSVFWLLFGSVTVSGDFGIGVHPPHFIIVLILLCYWSYRFIKDDISFLSSKDKQ